jgi:ABC-type lipoprotein export system ATPase subunit
VVVVTHDDHVAAAADRVIHMEDGRVADGQLRVM